MKKFQISVIVPIIYLTEYSRQAILDIWHKADIFSQINFIFSCSESVVADLKNYLGESEKCNVTIVSSRYNTSNNLRYNGLNYVKTPYVYYQDCDDEVDYQVVVNNLNHCNGENVVCFNIFRRRFDETGKVMDECSLFPDAGFDIKSTNRLMTNIVNKLIPTHFIKRVVFYNLPFSQDLCLSYQLFLLCDHNYVPVVAYYYENNPKSTAGYKKTKYNSLLRVCVMKGIISKKYRAERREKDAAYLEYRYDMMLETRFRYVGKLYFPKYKWVLFNPLVFGGKEVLKHIYHLFVSILQVIKYYICNVTK